MDKEQLQKITCICIIVTCIVIVGKIILSGYKNSESYTNTTPALLGPNNIVLTDNLGNLSSIQFPTGMIIVWQPDSNSDGKTPPSGWAICDGTNGTPDLRGKFVLGLNPSQGNSLAGFTKRIVGAQGGEENHQLTAGELPAHKHNLDGANNHIMLGDDNRNPRGCFNGAGSDYCIPSSTQPYGTSSLWKDDAFTGVVGSDGSHNNMPPYYVLIYIMKL
jgi:hypothetical protein